MSGRLDFYESPNGVIVSMIVPNTVLLEDGYYISYNDRDIAVYGSDTTALVKTGADGMGIKFLILNGNHYDKYKEIIDNGGSYENCLDYFLDNSSMINKMSD